MLQQIKILPSIPIQKYNEILSFKQCEIANHVIYHEQHFALVNKFIATIGETFPGQN